MTLTQNDRRTGDTYDLNELRELMEPSQTVGDERLRITVTSEHIRQGFPRDPGYCPLANAVRSALAWRRDCDVLISSFTTHFQLPPPGALCTRYVHEPALSLAIMEYDTYRHWPDPGRQYEMIRADALSDGTLLRWLLDVRLRHARDPMLPIVEELFPRVGSMLGGP